MSFTPGPPNRNTDGAFDSSTIAAALVNIIDRTETCFTAIFLSNFDQDMSTVDHATDNQFPQSLLVHLHYYRDG